MSKNKAILRNNNLNIGLTVIASTLGLKRVLKCHSSSKGNNQLKELNPEDLRIQIQKQVLDPFSLFYTGQFSRTVKLPHGHPYYLATVKSPPST